MTEFEFGVMFGAGLAVAFGALIASALIWADGVAQRRAGRGP